MNTEKSSMAGGVFMLFGLVVMLSVPMVVGHFALKAAPQVTVQADASNVR